MKKCLQNGQINFKCVADARLALINRRSSEGQRTRTRDLIELEK